MDSADRAALREVVDRQAIHDCMVRYARGVDRLDRELLLSAYHDDAIDDHGAFVVGAEQFADLTLPYHAEHQRCTNHLLLNHTCDLDGDTAHTETYCVYVGVNHSGTTDLFGNRYVDRLERRSGRWGIVRRVCVVEWTTSLPGSGQDDPLMQDAVSAMLSTGLATRDRSDVSYQRPLEIDPGRIPR